MEKSIFRNMRICRILPVLFSAVLTTVVHAQQNAGADDIEFSLPADAQSEALKVRNALLENNVFPQIRQGDRLMQEKSFQAAYQAYEHALTVLNNGKLGETDYIKSIRNKIAVRMVNARKNWGQAIFSDAKKLYLDALVVKDVPKALRGFRDAQVRALSALAPYYAGRVSFPQDQLNALIRKDKSFNENVQALIMDCSKMEDAYNFREETSLSTIDPDYKRRNSEIKLLLRQAETYYRNREFEKVRTAVEKVLVLDPYNQKAVTILNKTYKKLYKIGMARAENDALEQMAEVEWKWSEPIPPAETS
ncbi:MAG: hypothetical protein J5858_16460, partial [Lentisphaeria bacterium]|nr:hypothetical protein [Lentisphaeria bacterium]